MISWKPKPLQSMTESERDELFDSVFPIMLNEIDERDTPAFWLRPPSGDLEAWREHMGEECWTYVCNRAGNNFKKHFKNPIASVYYK